MKNCLTCKTRTKAETYWDENGGDYWYCAVDIPVQSFGVMWLANRNLNAQRVPGRLINLDIFGSDHETFKSVCDQECPLWSSEDDAVSNR